MFRKSFFFLIFLRGIFKRKSDGIKRTPQPFFLSLSLTKKRKSSSWAESRLSRPATAMQSGTYFFLSKSLSLSSTTYTYIYILLYKLTVYIVVYKFNEKKKKDFYFFGTKKKKKKAHAVHQEFPPFVMNSLIFRINLWRPFFSSSSSLSSFFILMFSICELVDLSERFF